MGEKLEKLEAYARASECWGLRQVLAASPPWGEAIHTSSHREPPQKKMPSNSGKPACTTAWTRIFKKETESKQGSPARRGFIHNSTHHAPAAWSASLGLLTGNSVSSPMSRKYFQVPGSSFHTLAHAHAYLDAHTLCACPSPGCVQAPACSAPHGCPVVPSGKRHLPPPQPLTKGA